MYLPPVSPVEARSIYRMLHVTPTEVKLDHLYEILYFASTFLHIVVRFLFLSLGLSKTLRDRTNRFAKELLELGIIRKIRVWCLYFLPPPRSAMGRTVAEFVSRFGSSRIGVWTRSFVSRWQPQLFRSVLIYYLLYTLLFTVLSFPLDYYGAFQLPHQYSLSRQPLLGWLGDFGKDTMVEAAGGAVVVSFIVWGIELFPRRWPVLFALWSAPIILVGIFLDPLFDRIDSQFTNLPISSPLYAPLHELATEAGVPTATILVADKSRQTEETNAYVTGIGSSAQIVLWDTTIRRMKPDEIIAITAHELGHFVEHHVLIGGALSVLALFVYLPVLKYLADTMIQRFGPRWEITKLSDPAALPLLFTLVGILYFATSPISNAISRVIEHRADSFGLALTRDRMSMAKAQVELANEDLDNPYPTQWEVFWLDDHPPTGERIQFALYGQPMKLHLR
jgi:STE24 endopeptidase